MFEHLVMQREHHPAVTVHNDPFGGVTIKLDDFDFVKIEYDPRYTDNAHQKRLVDHVLGFFEQGERNG
jgi:hypothetical protein